MVFKKAKEEYRKGRQIKEQKTKDDPVRIDCRECRTELETAEISRCPNCGFDPSKHKTWFYIHVLLAGIAAFSLIGIPLVPVFWWKGRKHVKKRRRGVAEKHWT